MWHRKPPLFFLQAASHRGRYKPHTPTSPAEARCKASLQAYLWCTHHRWLPPPSHHHHACPEKGLPSKGRHQPSPPPPKPGKRRRERASLGRREELMTREAPPPQATIHTTAMQLLLPCPPSTHTHLPRDTPPDLWASASPVQRTPPVSPPPPPLLRPRCLLTARTEAE